MGWLIAGVVVLLVLAAVAAVLAKKAGLLEPPAREKLPYEKKDYFFSKAERSFYGVLKQVVGDQLDIFGKVRLADVIGVVKGTDKWQTHFNKISSKHVDFLLCDPKLVAPVLVIELDDSSHKQLKRQERDKFVNDALADAGLPILHVPVQASYDPAALRTDIQQLLRKQ
jgi:hypothetical protein